MLNVPAVRARLVCVPCVVYFTKRDGTARRMVTAPTPEGCTQRTARDGSPMLRVWDVEAGELRTVNLATVYRLRVLRARAPRPADRPPVRHAEPQPPARPSRATLESWADDFAAGMR